MAAYANGMRDLLDILGIESATVVGHSLGGGVAAQLAYQYPDGASGSCWSRRAGWLGGHARPAPGRRPVRRAVLPPL